MGISANNNLENELRKIADYIVTLRQEIAALQANEMHAEKTRPRAMNSPPW